MTYFLSDPHYNHDREFIYLNTGFKNIIDYNEDLVRGINYTTNNKDTLYIAGDVSCGLKSIENSLEFFKRIKCKIILIKGNHDSELFDNDKIPSNVRLINSVYLDVKLNSQKITICHYPMLSWNSSHWNSWLLYGHVHNKKLPIDGKMFDICPKINHMFPYSFDEIKDIMNLKPNNWDFIELNKEVK